MASIEVLSISNLDGAAADFKLEQDHKRELNHKHKWTLGEALKSDNLTVKPRSFNKPGYDRREAEHDRRKAFRSSHSSRKRPSPFDTDNNTSDSSAEEDIREASAAPAPDAGITYSYDVPHGPSRGSDILTMAINKAVERFETKETEKLVKNEYEVVVKEVETGNEGYVADEDDYELV